MTRKYDTRTPQSCVIYRGRALGDGHLHRAVGEGGWERVGGTGGLALSPRQLSNQPSAWKRTIHSFITPQPSLGIVGFLALSVASEINRH